MNRTEARTQDSLTTERRDNDPKTLGELGLLNFAPYLMNRIMGRYNADVQTELKDIDLTTPQARALAVLSVVPGLTVNELAVYAVTEQSTMSRTLDTLERAELIRREGHVSDRRIRHVFLTEKGRETIHVAWGAMHRHYEQMLAGIGDAERMAFVLTLQKILANIRKHDF